MDEGGPGEALRSRHSCSGVSGSDLVVSERRASRLDLGVPVAAKGGVRPCSQGHGTRWGDQGGAAFRGCPECFNLRPWQNGMALECVCFCCCEF